MVVSDGLWALYGKGQTPDILRRCEGQPGCPAIPSHMARFVDGDRRYHLELCDDCSLPVLVELLRLGKPVSPAQPTHASGAGAGKGAR